MSPRLAGCALIVMLWSPEPVQTPALRSGDGLRIAEFATLRGRVSVYLPDDIRAGDVISGTVRGEPASRDSAAAAADASVLRGYSAELRDQRDSTLGGVQRVSLPGALAGTALWLVLKDRDGRPAGRVQLARSLPAATAPEPGIQGTPVQLPTVVQTDHPLEVTGGFDGDLGNTKVQVRPPEQAGGAAIPLTGLTESPRKAVFEVAGNIQGPLQIEIVEAERWSVAYPLWSAAVRLSA